jgi:hypothetical protein
MGKIVSRSILVVSEGREITYKIHLVDDIITLTTSIGEDEYKTDYASFLVKDAKAIGRAILEIIPN